MAVSSPARVACFALLLVLPILGAVGTLARGEDDARTKADGLFAEKNYAEAAALYEAVLAQSEDAGAVEHATRQLIACRVRLDLFDPALEAAEAWIERVKGTPVEARAERLAGNLWMSVPHWGTRAGGEFHRAQWRQGIQVRSFRHDKKFALGAFYRWCGDYVGFAQLRVEQSHPGAVAMFWQGCGGDQTPWPRGGTDVVVTTPSQIVS